MEGPQQNPSTLGPVAYAATTQSPTAGGPLTNPTGALDLENPLRGLVAVWIEKIRLANDWKRAKFDDDAQEGMAFFNGPYDWLYQKKYSSHSTGFSLNTGDPDEDFPAPTFQMTVNKVAEMVQLFGPALYYRNPTRQVNPRVLPPIPPQLFGDPANPATQMMAQQAEMTQQQMTQLDRVRASFLEAYLNYTPVELDLETNSRRAIDETIIKGMGVLWTELYQPPGANFKLVGSFYDTVDNLAIDPDLETIEDAKWIARKCVHPVWQVEDEYGLPRGSLRGNVESVNQQSVVNVDPDGGYSRQQGITNDLMVYWKIWSKMGVGSLLSGAQQNLQQVMAKFGNYCYLVVAEHTPYPLNLPPALIASADPAAAEQILSRLDWPTPFWADGEWPVTPIVFHEVPRSVWPMSHLKPALGELKFLNWAYSFLASKIRVTCRDFIAMKKSAGEELKDAILHGRDLTLLEIEAAHGTISEVVQFLNHPQINGDIWKVIESVTHNFEQRTGLTELMYGESPSAMRSASEANIKNNAMQARPDDMAKKIEQAMSKVARKEALAVRWHLGPQDVQEIFGPVVAQFWGQIVNSADLYAVVRQLEYRIEAGSTRKPNKDRDAANAQQAMQVLLQPLFSYAQGTGNFGPVNSLIQFWAKTVDMDGSGLVLTPPPPPMPAPPGPHMPPPGVHPNVHPGPPQPNAPH